MDRGVGGRGAAEDWDARAGAMRWVQVVGLRQRQPRSVAVNERMETMGPHYGLGPASEKSPPGYPGLRLGRLQDGAQRQVHVIVSTTDLLFAHETALLNASRYLVAVTRETPRSFCRNSILVYG